MSNFFDGREVLITGGTGSLGKTLVKLLMTEHRPKGIRIFSRGELLQWQMRNEFASLINNADLPPLAFLIGDVRDPARLRRAFKGVDIVIHTAAMKQVPACEDNPREAVQTNVLGSMNVMDAAIDCSVGRVMNVSTDKAVQSINLYGMTKATAEKLIVDGNIYTGGHGTILSSCRYGNVLGSRGSVAHIFKEQADKGQPITLTHRAMTRFWVTLPTVARFLLDRVKDMQGGEVFVPKMKSMSVYAMACAMGGKIFNDIGIRAGEKLHESLFHSHEYVYETATKYTVFSSPQSNRAEKMEQRELRSDRNPNGELTPEELLNMLIETGFN